MTVCFFGHRAVPEAIRPAVEREIERLIGCGADCFLVGHQGAFDTIVLGCLRRMALKYPTVNYRVVLAYMPKPGDNEFHPGETMLDQCISCMRCVTICPNQARYVPDEITQTIIKNLAPLCAGRKENRLYIGDSLLS